LIAKYWVDKWDVQVVPLAGDNLKIAQLLKLGACIRDTEGFADNKLTVPAGGWFAL
jgi:hypothetical protein